MLLYSTSPSPSCSILLTNMFFLQSCSTFQICTNIGSEPIIIPIKFPVVYTISLIDVIHLLLVMTKYYPLSSILLCTALTKAFILLILRFLVFHNPINCFFCQTYINTHFICRITVFNVGSNRLWSCWEIF